MPRLEETSENIEEILHKILNNYNFSSSQLDEFTDYMSDTYVSLNTIVHLENEVQGITTKVKETGWKATLSQT